jgi:Protein of unknown function (DUF2946)
MKFFLRCRLVSVAALATYLVVHVFAAVLHHHGADYRPGRLPIACCTQSQFQTSSEAENDHDEETCPLCSVLHLAQMLPTALRFEAITPLREEPLTANAIIRPHPLHAATYSRGPPVDVTA